MKCVTDGLTGTCSSRPVSSAVMPKGAEVRATRDSVCKEGRLRILVKDENPDLISKLRILSEKN
jgi:hypothetical protein